MEIITKNIKDLKKYEKNPRHNGVAVEKVAESIQLFGFKVPIVIDINNVIVCGHTRYEAAKRLNIDSVPCIIADDLTDEQIKAFRLVDNRTSDFANWDEDLLVLELDEIDLDLSEFSFDFGGFNSEDIEITENFTDNQKYFNIGLTFSTEHRDEIKAYMKKHKQEIIAEIERKAVDE